MLTSERFRTAKTQTGHQKKFRCRLVRLSMLKLGDGVWSRSRELRSGRASTSIGVSVPVGSHETLEDSRAYARVFLNFAVGLEYSIGSEPRPCRPRPSTSPKRCRHRRASGAWLPFDEANTARYRSEINKPPNSPCVDRSDAAAVAAPPQPIRARNKIIDIGG
jgi:hypothetical protein